MTYPHCSVLDRRKETRKRGISFHAPVMVPLSPHIRIVQDDPAYVSLVRDCCAPGTQRMPCPQMLTVAPMQRAYRRSSTKTTAHAMGSPPTPPLSCSWTACATSSISAHRRPAIGYAPCPLRTRCFSTLTTSKKFFWGGAHVEQSSSSSSSSQKLEQLTHRLDVFDDITTRLVPTDMLSQVRLAIKNA